MVTGMRETAVEKAKDVMQSSAEQYIFITGAVGAGKSTLGRALSRQLLFTLHRLDDAPDFRQMLQHDLPPDITRLTDPQRYARWQALRRHLVHEAIKLPEAAHHRGHTHPDRPRVDHRAQTDPGRYAIAPDYPATSGAGSRQVRRGPQPATPIVMRGMPGSVAARQRALRARQIYEGPRPEIDVFRQLPEVEIVPSRAFKTWLSQQVKTSAGLSYTRRR